MIPLCSGGQREDEYEDDDTCYLIEFEFLVNRKFNFRKLISCFSSVVLFIPNFTIQKMKSELTNDDHSSLIPLPRRWKSEITSLCSTVLQCEQDEY